MSDVLEQLEENEKQTILNALQFLSQGIGLDRADEFNHLHTIAKKVEASLEPEEKTDG